MSQSSGFLTALDRSQNITSTDIHIGKQLRCLRTLSGLSQKNLAHRFSISTQQIQKYESGINEIRMSRLFDFARYFGVSVEFFFERSSSNICSTSDLEYSASLFDAEDVSLLLKRKTVSLIQVYRQISNHDVRRKLLRAVEALASFEMRK